MKKRHFVGIYEIGYERCRLFASDGRSGSFHFLPKGDSKLPEIIVGVDEDKWWQVMLVLQHEAFEFAMTRNNCRFQPNNDLGECHASYLFVMDHTQFSHICGVATDFVSSCQSDLHKVWKKRKQLGLDK